MEEQRKRRRGDRIDAVRVRNLDGLHAIIPSMLPNRTDNEAFISLTIDVTNLEAYLAKKNAKHPEHRYTMFQIVLAAVGRMIAMRPRMNRFIMGEHYYDRQVISFSLIAKKAFKDDGAESIAILKYDPENELSSAEMMHKRLTDFVYEVRTKDQTDNTTGIIDLIVKTGLTKFIMNILRKLDKHGHMPNDIAREDPYNSTVFLSNLGSLKLSAGYHHLTNWGTNSIFVVMGEKHLEPFYDEVGNVTMRPVVEFGLTIDERIADGYYYARSVNLLKQLLANPELLDKPAKEELKLEY